MVRFLLVFDVIRSPAPSDRAMRARGIVRTEAAAAVPAPAAGPAAPPPPHAHAEHPHHPHSKDGKVSDASGTLHHGRCD